MRISSDRSLVFRNKFVAMTGLVIVLGLGLGLVQGLRLVVCLTADTRFI